MSNHYVCGEQRSQLIQIVRNFDSSEAEDGMIELSFTSKPEEVAPLMRALKRKEAELLIWEADHHEQTDLFTRTPEQRSADAFVELCNELFDMSASSRMSA